MIEKSFDNSFWEKWLGSDFHSKIEVPACGSPYLMKCQEEKSQDEDSNVE